LADVVIPQGMPLASFVENPQVEQAFAIVIAEQLDLNASQVLVDLRRARSRRLTQADPGVTAVVADYTLLVDSICAEEIKAQALVMDKSTLGIAIATELQECTGQAYTVVVTDIEEPEVLASSTFMTSTMMTTSAGLQKPIEEPEVSSTLMTSTMTTTTFSLQKQTVQEPEVSFTMMTSSTATTTEQMLREVDGAMRLRVGQWTMVDSAGLAMMIALAATPLYNARAFDSGCGR